MILFSVIMTGCATDPKVPGPRYTSPELIVGRTWGWEKTETPVELFEVAAPERYTLHVTLDGAIQILVDCNRGSAGYKIVGGDFQVTPAKLTKMACPTGNASLAHHFVQQLQGVSSYYVQDGKLYLAKPDNSGTMQFKEIKP